MRFTRALAIEYAGQGIRINAVLQAPYSWRGYDKQCF
jgi:NAD(P)-dependent dehydrogenase (short-subunit alcohol dehydrogenase family)